MKINRQNLLIALCISLGVIGCQHRQDIAKMANEMFSTSSSPKTHKVKTEAEVKAVTKVAKVSKKEVKVKEVTTPTKQQQVKEKPVPQPTKVAQKTKPKAKAETTTQMQKPAVKKPVVKKPAVNKPAVNKPVVKNPEAKKPIVAQRKGPEINFKQAVYSFGEITEGDIIKHQFKFTNTGDKELEVLTAYASCGCTDPSYPFLGIAPGEDGVIGVTYNSVSKDGPQQVEVTITTNADKEAFKLFLTGTVKPKPEKSKIEADSSQLTKVPKYPVKKS